MEIVLPALIIAAAIPFGLAAAPYVARMVTVALNSLLIWPWQLAAGVWREFAFSWNCRRAHRRATERERYQARLREERLEELRNRIENEVDNVGNRTFDTLIDEELVQKSKEWRRVKTLHHELLKSGPACLQTVKGVRQMLPPDQTARVRDFFICQKKQMEVTDLLLVGTESLRSSTILYDDLAATQTYCSFESMLFHCEMCPWRDARVEHPPDPCPTVEMLSGGIDVGNDDRQ